MADLPIYLNAAAAFHGGAGGYYGGAAENNGGAAAYYGAAAEDNPAEDHPTEYNEEPKAGPSEKKIKRERA